MSELLKLYQFVLIFVLTVTNSLNAFTLIWTSSDTQLFTFTGLIFLKVDTERRMILCAPPCLL